jgi:hypothetical protein
MNKTENPSAFPWANDADKQYNWISRGMTLRDYFAAKAMQGLIASPRVTPDGRDATDTDYAKCAYLMADAMLKAREA